MRTMKYLFLGLTLGLASTAGAQQPAPPPPASNQPAAQPQMLPARPSVPRNASGRVTAGPQMLPASGPASAPPAPRQPRPGSGK